jgi:N-acetylmuramoyl-L-alanine amidase CwlA
MPLSSSQHPLRSSISTSQLLTSPPSQQSQTPQSSSSSSSSFRNPRSQKETTSTKTKTKNKNKNKKTTPQKADFELTPLSGLIAQSYSDIRILKGMMNGGVELQQQQQQTREKKIDFEKMEQNLRSFEEYVFIPPPPEK